MAQKTIRDLPLNNICVHLPQPNILIMATSDKGKIAAPRKKREAWTEEKVDVICKAIAEGKTYESAYKAARVAKAAFYARLKTDKDFKDRVKKAEQEFNEYFDANIVSVCKRSLVELITGYEYDEVTTESYIDGRTGKRVTRKKVSHKKVAPNSTAVIFTLCNRDPEHWQNRINNELSGKIETETKSEVSLTNIPDELLAQVIDAIHGKE